jgi:hypothetical protein
MAPELILTALPVSRPTARKAMEHPAMNHNIQH